MNKLKYNLSVDDLRIRWLILVLSAGAVFIFFIFFWSNPSEKAQADVGGNLAVNPNVYGWAWNNNYGWISFNHLNCDQNNNGFIDAGGCSGSDNASTPVVDHYGVNVDTTTGVFTGYAWSDILGYIRFDPPDIPPGLPNSGVILNTANSEVSGWARICSKASIPNFCTGGANGWIKTRCEGVECTASNYGVRLNKANQLEGFGWNDEVGWISFSSHNCDSNKDGLSEGSVSGCPVNGTPMAQYGVGVAINNVHGWAWNENFGWISMNCLDAYSDGNEKNNCGGGFYGVDIDDDDLTFTGFGWSSNAGWISFEGKNPPDSYTFNSNCKTGAICDSSNNCTACLNNNRVYGWAKILSLDNDGWLRLDDDNTGDGYAYGVNINQTTGDFFGWAWNNRDNNFNYGLGWVSFNANDCDNNGSIYLGTPANCPVNGTPFFAYKVYANINLNTPPTVTANAPFLSDLCTEPLAAFLPWNYADGDGDAMDGYQIQIQISGGDWSSPVIDLTVDPSGSVVQYAFDLPDIAYGTTYNWRVKVKDINGAWSTDWSYGADFTTALHDYPSPSFSWLPDQPSVDEDVQFTDTSVAYGGSSVNGWLWTFANVSEVDGFPAPPDISSSQNPIVKFSALAGATAQLLVTDLDGYSCSAGPTAITTKLKLPTWKEVK